LKFRAAGLTDIGCTRKENQDSFLIEELAVGDVPALLAIVADGVGGSKAGSIASGTLVNALREFYKKTGQGDLYDLRRAIEEANRILYKMASENSEYAGMATTCTGMLIVGQDVTIGHAGDSRAYKMRNGNIEMLTEDDTLVGRMLREGLITSEEAKDHPQRHVITRAVGAMREILVSIYKSRIGENDRFLLCSDGLYKYFSEEELIEITSKTPVDISVERLVDMAKERGGEDNITAVLVEAEAKAGRKTERIECTDFDPKPKRRARAPCLVLIMVLILAGILVYIRYS